MKSPRFWLSIFGMLMAVLAIRPMAEVMIRSEFQRRTGSAICMDRCRINLLTGSVLIEQAMVDAGPDADGHPSGQPSSVKIAKIWSKGSLNQLLYRKLHAPVTIMDGVVLRLSQSDENQVPSVLPATSSSPSRPISNPFLSDHFSDQVDRAFRESRQGLQTSRSEFERIEQQLSAIENQDLHAGNPLRDRAAVLSNQQRVTSLQRELDNFQRMLEQQQENFQQVTATMPRSIPTEDLSSPDADGLDAEEERAIESLARMLTERLVCNSVEQMKPYLGLSASLARRWLLPKANDLATGYDRKKPKPRADARGQNYLFGSMHEDEILFRSVRLRGSAAIDSKPLPFSGHMKNIGSQSLAADHRPSFDFLFADMHEPGTDQAPRVSINASIVPDRQGFRIQYRMVPVGSMIGSASQGDWQLAAFGQNAMVNLVWLVHQSEWALDVDIRSSQCEVVVKRGAATPAADETVLEPRFEPCFVSEDSVSLARAKFQGDMNDGQPRQRSMICESPFFSQLAGSMVVQNKMALEVGEATERQRAEAAFKQSWSDSEAEIELSHLQLAEAHSQLQRRLEQYQSKIAERTPIDNGLRFSRTNPTPNQR